MENKYLRILPILGGIISLISLLFPAVYVNTVILFFHIEVYIWFNGYYEATALGKTNTGYLTDPIFAFCTLLVVISSFITIGMKKENLWLVMPIIQIVAVIIWLIAIPYTFPDIDFWAWYKIGSGIIGILFGSILVIIGFSISKIINEQNK